LWLGTEVVAKVYKKEKLFLLQEELQTLGKLKGIPGVVQLLGAGEFTLLTTPQGYSFLYPFAYH
jgi:hypothetical protein